MTIRFIDGFDIYNDKEDANRKEGWYIQSGFTMSNTTTPWGIGRSLGVGGTLGSGGTAFAFLPALGSPPVWGTEITVGVAFRHRDPTELGIYGIQNSWLGVAEYKFPNQFRDLIFLYSAEDGSLIIYRNDATPTILWSKPAGFFEFNSWDYWELSVVIDGSAGKVRLDRNGETLCDLSGIDTIPDTTLNASVTVACASFREPVSLNIPTIERAWDDLYLGDEFTDILGPQRIITLLPDGDAIPSLTNGWLPSDTSSPAPGNYEMVDDSALDDDSTYVYTSNPGAEDLYTLEDLPEGVKVINAVKQTYFARKTQTETHYMVGLFQSGATIEEGPPLYLAPYYRGGTSEIYLTDPNTAAAWTESAVNALKIGQKLVL